MIYQYEIACKEAGMSEDAIKALRRMFDLDYKHLLRENEQMKRYGIEVLHIEELVGPDGKKGTFEIEDPSPTPEEAFFHQCDLERLNELLAEMDAADRVFLLDCFDADCGLKEISEKYEITISSAFRRKTRLFKTIRKKFFED